jgi:hypothetical protein
LVWSLGTNQRPDVGCVVVILEELVRLDQGVYLFGGEFAVSVGVAFDPTPDEAEQVPGQLLSLQSGSYLGQLEDVVVGVVGRRQGPLSRIDEGLVHGVSGHGFHSRTHLRHEPRASSGSVTS